MKNKYVKILPLGGISGAILFTIITIVCASWRSDYSHLHNFISELGASDTYHYQIMNYIGFISSGILIGCFGVSLMIVSGRHLTALFGSTLVILFGIGITLAGAFSCDKGCPPTGSEEAAIHDLVSAVAFFSAIIGLILSAYSFKQSPTFQQFSTYTLLSGVLAAVFLFTMIGTFESRLYTGLWQRLLLLTLFTWTSVMGIHVFKKIRDIT